MTGQPSAFPVAQVSDVSRVIALLGAPGTGKTTLARELSRMLNATGIDAAMVPDALALFTQSAGRAPDLPELAGVAAEQTRLIRQARTAHAVVVADTSALAAAVQAEWRFADARLYGQTLRDHGADVDMTLLMSIDLAWTPSAAQSGGGRLEAGAQASKHEQRQAQGKALAPVHAPACLRPLGPASEPARERVDGLIRSALQQSHTSYAVVAGQGVARVQHGLAAIDHLLSAPARQAARAAGRPRWKWFCDNCDDGECEQHWLAGARMSSGG